MKKATREAKGDRESGERRTLVPFMVCWITTTNEIHTQKVSLRIVSNKMPFEWRDLLKF